MSRGIMINGAAGTGKTTLAGELAKQLGFQQIDLDDYYYRRDTKTPYSESCSREEIRERVMNEILKHTHFVMSGSIGSILWDLVNPLFDLAVLLIAPVEIRVERIIRRGMETYGERSLISGDIYEHHKFMLHEAEQYETGKHPEISVTLERHERWVKELLCPVLRLDGTKPISENTAYLLEQYNLLSSFV